MFYCGKNLVKYGDRAAVTDETGAALLDGVSFPDNRALCEKPLGLFSRLRLAKEKDPPAGAGTAGPRRLSVRRDPPKVTNLSNNAEQ